MRVERDMATVARVADPPNAVRVILDGDLDSVRTGLIDLFNNPILADLTLECRGTSEIVLAEVLNNVVEHAYAAYSGRIVVWVTRGDADLTFRVIDSGLPMPGLTLPNGDAMTDDEIEALPEGGFGWFLIRTLTKGLNYSRDGDRNVLSFCVSGDYQA